MGTLLYYAKGVELKMFASLGPIAYKNLRELKQQPKQLHNLCINVFSHHRTESNRHDSLTNRDGCMIGNVGYEFSSGIETISGQSTSRKTSP